MSKSVEENFYYLLDLTKKRIVEYENEKVQIKNSTDEIGEKLKALGIAIQTIGDAASGVAGDALRKEIENLSNDLRRCGNRKIDVIKKIKEYNDDLLLLRQICPHKDYKLTRFDGHKGEQYYECNLCGYEW